ncbi:MAG: protein kinase [Solirubrobacteraceae bacterium]
MPYAPDLSGSALDDRYELHAVIGEGAFGRVYEGRDRRLERPVAVKVIKPWWTDDPEWVATFEREARLLARLSDPGIVQIFDVGHAPQGLYYVSELVDGENLAVRLRRGAVPAWEACDIATQLCRALAAAHARRIVHRDVKPANILLSTEGRVKVGDFGVARLAEGSTDGAAATIVGTPKYMAPEQGRGMATSPSTDVYSVGVVLYEMLSGEAPFTGQTVVELALRHLTEAPASLSPGLPAGLVQITERALRKDPADRYADGAEMAEALLAVRRSRDTAHARRPVRALAGAGIPRGSATALPPLEDRDRETPVILTPPPRRPDDTRRAIAPSPRRNVNPPARRRAIAALTFVALLIAAMAAGAIALTGAPRTRVPELLHLRAAGVRRAVRRAHVRVTFSHGYSRAAIGTVIRQRPAAGSVVSQGSRIGAVISKGPAPVMVPIVRHEALADAEQSLHSLGLRTAVHSVPGFGAAAGSVIAQTPAGGGSVPAGSTVTLSVAQPPSWRPVTSFTGTGSGPFTIAGSHWRLSYTMSFAGTCTWIIFCSGPSARVINTTTGQTVARFGLNDGTGQIQGVAAGPGHYEIVVTPGGDTANWSIQAQDYY